VRLLPTPSTTHPPPHTHQSPNRTDFCWFEFGSVRLHFLKFGSGSVRFELVFWEPVRVRFGSSFFSKTRFEFGSVRLYPLIYSSGSVRFDLVYILSTVNKKSF